MALRQRDTHRLIPSKYSEGGESVLARVADDADLAAVFDLDHATNDRLLAENGLLPGIGLAELVFGVPHYRIINAAFCHAHPLGSRFNGPDRGAWYAGFELETSQAEVALAQERAAGRGGAGGRTASPTTTTSPTSRGEFHDLRGDPAFAACLDPDSYVASQELAAAAPRGGLARRGLSERPTRRRHLPRLLPPGARRLRPQGRPLPLHLGRRANADDCARGGFSRTWLSGRLGRVAKASVDLSFTVLGRL